MAQAKQAPAGGGGSGAAGPTPAPPQAAAEAPTAAEAPAGPSSSMPPPQSIPSRHAAASNGPPAAAAGGDDVLLLAGCCGQRGSAQPWMNWWCRCTCVVAEECVWTDSRHAVAASRLMLLLHALRATAPHPAGQVYNAHFIAVQCVASPLRSIWLPDELFHGMRPEAHGGVCVQSPPFPNKPHATTLAVGH